MPYKYKDSPEAKASQSRRNKKWYEANKSNDVEFVIPEVKKCHKCNKEKHKSEFYARKDRPNGLSSWCKKCLLEYTAKWKDRNRTTKRMRNFGITEDEYNKLFGNQGGECAICGVKQTEIKYSLCVDHCHSTGKVRGLLCHDCNVCIGKAKDNISILNNAIKYLNK